MRYELDANGYVLHTYFGGYSGNCTEYTGTVPAGYIDLVDWSENAIINTYYIDEDGNLILDAERLEDIEGRIIQDTIDNQPILYKDLYGTNNVLAEQYQSETVSGLVVEATNVKNISPKVLITGIECYNYNKIDIVMQGKQLLNNEAKTETISGVTFRRNYDGSILINGTATEDIEYNICGGSEKTSSIFALKKNTDYYLNLDGLECSLKYYDGTTHQVYEGASGVINVPENKEVSQVLLKIPAGTSYENNVIYPMLNLGAEPYEYEEYQRRMITFDISEYIEPEVLHPADDLLPADDLYPLGTGIEYIYIEDGIAIISVNGEEKFLGKGNVNLFSDYDLVYTMQDTKIEMTYSTNALRLEGVETKNKGFRIDEEGNVYATSGEIGGYTLGTDRFTSEIIPPKDFTMEDITKVQQYILGNVELTEEEFEAYDLNKDGKVTLPDMVLIQSVILSNVSSQKPGTVEINSKDVVDTILIKDGDGKRVVSLGLLGIDTPKLSVKGQNVAENKDLIKVRLTSNFTTTAKKYTVVPFDAISEQLNEFDSFDFDNAGAITITSDTVKKVRIYASVLDNAWASKIHYLTINKNGTIVKRVYMRNATATQIEGEILVDNGDVITITFYCETAVALTSDQQYTQLTVSVG